MNDQNEKINQLNQRLEFILNQQEDFLRELKEVRYEIALLKINEEKANSIPNKSAINKGEPEVISVIQETNENRNTISVDESVVNVSKQQTMKFEKSNLEKFIGENLINKIGIGITVIGVAIGAKYSIENGLVSPLTRIILGYLMGLGLLVLGLKLKQKYENYSAVLVSGAMAILYFITYFAYDLYSLIPQILAFIFMLIFTCFTVVAALNYNRQIIAHIGLVGAYGVPFLLSDGSGNATVLFTYMALINIGILAIAFKKYWKPLNYLTFALTWLTYLSWYIFQYQVTGKFQIAVVFCAVFFVIFYICFLAYKLIQKENFAIHDVVLLLINSFVFYTIDYSICIDFQYGQERLGLFTLVNAIVHFIVSVFIYKQKLADKNIFYLIAGLVLVFITIAVPIQLNGNWVTLIWAAQAVLLFWIGRTKAVFFYEKLAYPLLLLSLISLFDDWNYFSPSINYMSATTIPNPLYHIGFFSSLLYIALLSIFYYFNQKPQYLLHLQKEMKLVRIATVAIQMILIFVVYNTFLLEIAHYWDKKYYSTAIQLNAENPELKITYWNHDLILFKSIWTINYTLLFLSILVFIVIKKSKSQTSQFFLFGLVAFTILAFLTKGLFDLSELRQSYLNQVNSQYYKHEKFNLWIRYLSFIFVAFSLFSIHKLIVIKFKEHSIQVVFELLTLITVLWIASSELIHWLDIYKFTQSYKLGLSILWGVYSLFLIAFGIWKAKQHLRIGAIVLFGITLLKLFFYDIAHLNNISKTIVFVSLGVLLLIISFLYNKYKHIIANDKSNI